MTVLEHVGTATDALVEAGLAPEAAAIDAEVLARHVLGWDRTSFVCNRRQVPPPSFAASYRAVLARRARREPVSLIVGHREFWGLDFEVERSVLTPRPETELLVEESLRVVREGGRSTPLVVDVGTGSGCVAVALARELPEARVVATDISAHALQVARRNAARNGVGDRIDWVQCPYLDGVTGAPGLIVANPPYITDQEAEALPPEVRDYEPPSALMGGDDGLDVIRPLVSVAAHRLPPGGYLVMEFGAGQLAPVRRCVRAQPGLSVARVRHDLQRIPRAIVARRARDAAHPEARV